ncbi:MAG: HEAT repeat domain-containing protein [Bryobacteraceae bacterium]|jgi:hypothetical protein
MRKRVENRLRKAIRIASQAEPSFALRIKRLERTHRTFQESLVGTTEDRTAPVAERKMAAELLALAKCADPYRPLLDHFLDCDGTTAWSLISAFPHRELRLSQNDEDRLERILWEDPDEQRRAATAQFFQYVETPPRTKMLIGVLENRAETSLVRGRAAEALTCIDNAYKTGAVDACIRCLDDPDPEARFWAVFALGQMVRFRPAFHSRAIAALQPMTSDAGQVPSYWPVGHEARAMLEDFIPEQRVAGERERAAILADPNAPDDLRRWAKSYSGSRSPKAARRPYIEARYKNLRWLRFPK